MVKIPDVAIFVPQSNNDDELAVFARHGYNTEIIVHECWHDEEGAAIMNIQYGAHLYLTPEEARALAEALLQVATEAAPSTKDALIDRALSEALDALEDVQLIDNTVNEAFTAQSEIETILQVFTATARRIAHQEARDAE